MFKILMLMAISFGAAAQNYDLSNESEVSLIQAGGNSAVETYNVKTDFKNIYEKRVFTYGGHYTLGYADQEDEMTGKSSKYETARNWDGHARYDQTLSEKFDGFFIGQIEGNRFAGYKQRENVDIGVKYVFVKTDYTHTFIEFGYRNTVEKTVLRDEDGADVFNFSKARLYYERNHKISEEFGYKFWAEYVPNFTETEDYLISFEPSIFYILSNSFSLKTAYKGVYDNQPAVNSSNIKNEYLDYTFTTSLIAKF